MLISLSNGTFQLRSSPLTTIMWGSGEGGTELCLSQTEGRCRQTLPGAGSPIFCVCGLQDCGLLYWRSPHAWRRVSSPCCLYPSFTLNFHHNHFISVIWGLQKRLPSRLYWMEENVLRDFPLSAVNLQKSGMSAGCPWAQGGLYWPSNVQLLLFSFWRKTERHKNPEGSQVPLKQIRMYVPHGPKLLLWA